MNRRDFLISSLLSCAISSFPTIAFGKEKFPQSPFLLGIASGDPEHNSMVLWTRLVLDPTQSDGAMQAVIYNVNWQLASDPQMKNIVKSGTRQASPQLAHSVHVDVDGLAPDRHYWYQFSVGNYQSEIGKTKTLPMPDATSVNNARFVTSSCQNYTHGHFVAYQHMIEDNPDFVIFLGDYIYDKSFGQTVRRHDSEIQPTTIDQYRLRHALYKTDQHLQNAHANMPFFVIPDNHDALEDNDKTRYQQRIAAYQAWYEHMPTRGYDGIGANHFQLHRHIQYGNLLNINLLDSRQYRDKQRLANDKVDLSYAFGNNQILTPQHYQQERSLLGKQQEQWLYDSIINNQSAWQVIASPGPFTPFQYVKDGKSLRYIGSWDGYPAAQQRLIEVLKSTKKNNHIVLSGDVHSFWACDGMQCVNEKSNIPIVEFITSSITAGWPEPLSKPIEDSLSHNPQVSFYDDKFRGYMLHEVNAKTWQTSARAMNGVLTDKTKAFTRAKFQVNNGKHGFKQII